LAGAMLLIDESDDFVLMDIGRGNQWLSELRSLVQEEVCSLVLTGYGALYRASLDQKTVLYNFASPLFLGPLEHEPAVILATNPFEGLGIVWKDVDLARRLVTELGDLPHLVQDACRRLLLRMRGEREPTIDEHDLKAVLTDWRPRGEPDSLRGYLLKLVQTNLRGPALATVWLLARDHPELSLQEIRAALTEAGFEGIDAAGLEFLAQTLQVSGTCHRQVDQLRWAVPLLSKAMEELDTEWRLEELQQDWEKLGDEERAGYSFWGR